MADSQKLQVVPRSTSGERKVRLPLGEYLVTRGDISREQLEISLEQQKRTGRLLGEVLLDLGFLNEEALAGGIASQAGVEYVSLKGVEVDAPVLDLVQEALARKHRVLPLSRRGPSLRVAMANVLDVVAVDEVEKAAKCRVVPLAASGREIVAAIDHLYARRERFEDIFERLIHHAEQRQAATADDLAVAANAGAIVELVDKLIDQAVEIKATDLHVEPEEKVTRSRFRIDGLLQAGPSLPKGLHGPVIGRIKVMAKLNISESRLPQDGKVRFETANKKQVDLRVSTFLTNHGENLVLRVLDREAVVLALDQLGMSTIEFTRFTQLIKKPNGIMLVTGPTGSGKTTTLYAALSQLNSIEKNIMTVEDPIEYELPVIRQSQINVKAGITFASGLRAILRQDPDIVLIGETRDEETAEMAVRAAMTGHLVFTTLHTNSAVGAIPRLVDLGVAPFLIGNSVVGSLAQRLVRVLCRFCKEPGTVPERHRESFERVVRSINVAHKVCAARSCAACKRTGYAGRTGVYELLEMVGEVRRIILDGRYGADLEDAARAQVPRTVYEDGLAKVAAGVTSFFEIERVLESDQWHTRASA